MNMTRLPDFRRPRRRRRRLKSLAFVPSTVTLGNLVCGFAAIHFAARALFDSMNPSAASPGVLSSPLLERMMPSHLSVGAGLIMLGMILDSIDGLLARVTRSTTDFGGQLDSLADVVTFGVAPATLMVAFMTIQLVGDAIVPSPISSHFLGRLAWVSAAVYVAFTAIRLARYNVEHTRADFDYRTFRGLPSPGAAALIVAILLFQDQPVGEPFRQVIVYALPIITMITAFLMVSRIPYRRFYRLYLVGDRPYGQFVVFVLILAVFWLYKAPTLVFLVAWYWLSGPVLYSYHFIKRRHLPVVSTHEETRADSGRRQA